MREMKRFVVVGVVLVCMVLVSIVGASISDNAKVPSSTPTSYSTAQGSTLDHVDSAELDRLIQNPDDEYVTYVRPKELLYSDSDDEGDLGGKIQKMLDTGIWDCVDVKADEEANSLVFTFTQEQRREHLAYAIRFLRSFGGEGSSVPTDISDDYRSAKVFVNADEFGEFLFVVIYSQALAQTMADVQLLSGFSGYVWRVDWVDEGSGRVVMSFDSVSEHGHIVRHCGGGCIETYGGRVDITREYWRSLFEAQD